MKIVVGLGNPGKKYERTPHNIGFLVLGELAKRFPCALRRSMRFRARLGRTTMAGYDVLLVMPRTYMNLSGEAVGSVARYYRVSPCDVVVVLDDADLDAGRLRVRPRGGSGGHRGLKSVIEALGTDAFPRVRIGIGREHSGSGLVSHVLQPFSEAELGRMQPVVERAASAVEKILDAGAEAAMNEFNAGPDGTQEKDRTGEPR